MPTLAKTSVDKKGTNQTKLKQCFSALCDLCVSLVFGIECFVVNKKAPGIITPGALY
jgi:hypothetical protein